MTKLFYSLIFRDLYGKKIHVWRDIQARQIYSRIHPHIFVRLHKYLISSLKQQMSSVHSCYSTILPRSHICTNISYYKYLSFYVAVRISGKDKPHKYHQGKNSQLQNIFISVLSLTHWKIYVSTETKKQSMASILTQNKTRPITEYTGYPNYTPMHPREHNLGPTWK